MPAIAESCGIYIEYDGYVCETEDPEDPQEGEHHYYLTDYTVFVHVLEPYLNGDLTAHEVHKRLIRSSPRHFAEYLDNVQFHHGLLDMAVRPDQSVVLNYALRGVGADNYEFHWYEFAGHNIDIDDTDQGDEEYGDVTGEWLDSILDLQG